MQQTTKTQKNQLHFPLLASSARPQWPKKLFITHHSVRMCACSKFAKYRPSIVIKGSGPHHAYKLKQCNLTVSEWWSWKCPQGRKWDHMEERRLMKENQWRERWGTENSITVGPCSQQFHKTFKVQKAWVSVGGQVSVWAVLQTKVIITIQSAKGLSPDTFRWI